MKLEFYFFLVGIPVVIALVVIMRVDLILQYFSDRKDGDGKRFRDGSILDTDDTDESAADENDAGTANESSK